MKQWELRGITVGMNSAGDVPIRAGEGLDPLRILVNQVPALFWTTDADLILTSSLGAEFEKIGVGPNQLVGTSLSELFETDGDGDLIVAHHRALAGSSVRFGASWARSSFRARVAPLRDSSGQVIGTICVAVSDDESLREQESSARLMSTA